MDITHMVHLPIAQLIEPAPSKQRLAIRCFLREFELLRELGCICHAAADPGPNHVPRLTIVV